MLVLEESGIPEYPEKNHVSTFLTKVFFWSMPRPRELKKEKAATPKKNPEWTIVL